MAVLLFVDGVLRNSQRAPIRTGMLLYHSLKEKNRVLLLCSDKEKDDNWLRQQKINNYDDIVGLDIPALGDFPELRQVEYLHSQGPVDFVVTTDPTLTARLLGKGITTMLFASPIYIQESFRPDSKQGVRAWDDIVEEIAKQQDAYREDPRVQ